MMEQLFSVLIAELRAMLRRWPLLRVAFLAGAVCWILAALILFVTVLVIAWEAVSA